jgi:EpsD family peptidyl-prolyl cis-trans isomerase
MRKLGVVWVGCLMASLLLSGCQKEATGQVAAIVNDEEVTLQEVNAELGRAQIPEGVDKKQVQQGALQRIVERRLLAQAAREDGLDKTPEFLIRRRQLEDALLVQLLGEKLGRTTSVPEASAVDAFMRQNPAVFGGRAILTLDRIQFAMPSNVNRLRSLESAHSMDEVAAKLQQMGIQFSRGAAQMDSAALGQDRLNRIRALPEGEPFVMPENGMVTVGVITGETPRPVLGDQGRPVAVQMMRNQSLSDAMRSRLASEKAEGKIEYQPGFAPPAAPSTATPAAASTRAAAPAN